MDGQQKEHTTDRPPQDLPRRQPGKSRAEFFALCTWSDLTNFAQLFAYYTRYAEGRETLTIRDFCQALPPLVSGTEPVPGEAEIEGAVRVGIDRGIFKEVAPNRVALTYSGYLVARDLPYEAVAFLWNDGWPIEWAKQIGAKTITDRLIAYTWYLEQCRQSHPDGAFRDEFLAHETEIANPRQLLAQACNVGWLERVRRGVYAMTDAGRDRVLSGFPSLYRTHRRISGTNAITAEERTS
jgi:hypothetical protein